MGQTPRRPGRLGTRPTASAGFSLSSPVINVPHGFFLWPDGPAFRGEASMGWGAFLGEAGRLWRMPLFKRLQLKVLSSFLVGYTGRLQCAGSGIGGGGVTACGSCPPVQNILHGSSLTVTILWVVTSFLSPLEGSIWFQSPWLSWALILVGGNISCFRALEQSANMMCV